MILRSTDLYLVGYRRKIEDKKQTGHEEKREKMEERKRRKDKQDTILFVCGKYFYFRINQLCLTSLANENIFHVFFHATNIHRY
jgi:hypothetical protein